MGQGYQVLPADGANPRQIATVVNSIRQGKINSILDLKLATSTVSTSIAYALAHPAAFADLMVIPGTSYTADLVSAKAAGNIFISTLDKGSIVLTHGSYTDSRSVRLIILG